MHQTWTVHTDVFDGPMDLLLYLVQRDGIDLTCFPVARIADAYLAWLDRMRDLHLGVAAEYLVMAATLVHLKSLTLLPRPPTPTGGEDELEPDPREAFAQRLLEYQRYKDAALALDQGVQVGRETFVRAPQRVPTADRPMVSPIDAFGLLDLYYDILNRSKVASPGFQVAESGPDLVACCRVVVERLRAHGGRGELGAILRSLADVPRRVVTFVGVLEMARLGWVDVNQAAHLAPVDVVLLTEHADFGLLSGEVVAAEAG